MAGARTTSSSAAPCAAAISTAPFPASGLGHALDVGSGSLLPTISVDQYGATLAKWFGVPDSQLGEVFPNLANFTQRDLGFMSV